MEITKTRTTLFPKDISKDQCIGTGMAMVLILIILGLYTGSYGENILYFKIAIPVLLISMTVPKLFYPLAIVWFGIANLLGAIMSKVVLTLLFVLLVIPFGVVRRMLGHDPMKLKGWKKSNASIFKDRDKTFVPADLVHPY
jgi:uncharacterized membrane protein YGL010W